MPACGTMYGKMIGSHGATIPNCCFLNDRELDVATVADLGISAHVGKQPITDDNKQEEW